MRLLGWFPVILTQVLSVLLPFGRSILWKPCFSSYRLTEDAEQPTHKTKDSGDFAASWAFHTHEVGIAALCQALLAFPLLFWRGMEEILSMWPVVMGRLSLLKSRC